MLKQTILCIAITLIALVHGGAPAGAQEIKRTILQKSDVPGSNYETVFGMVEIPPNLDVALHIHPGTESGYVLEGACCFKSRDSRNGP